MASPEGIEMELARSSPPSTK